MRGQSGKKQHGLTRNSKRCGGSCRKTTTRPFGAHVQGGKLIQLCRVGVLACLRPVYPAFKSLVQVVLRSSPPLEQRMEREREGVGSFRSLCRCGFPLSFSQHCQRELMRWPKYPDVTNYAFEEVSPSHLSNLRFWTDIGQNSVPDGWILCHWFDKAVFRFYRYIAIVSTRGRGACFASRGLSLSFIIQVSRAWRRQGVGRGFFVVVLFEICITADCYMCKVYNKVMMCVHSKCDKNKNRWQL